MVSSDMAPQLFPNRSSSADPLRAKMGARSPSLLFTPATLFLQDSGFVTSTVHQPSVTGDCLRPAGSVYQLFSVFNLTYTMRGKSAPFWGSQAMQPPQPPLRAAQPSFLSGCSFFTFHAHKLRVWNLGANDIGGRAIPCCGGFAVGCRPRTRVSKSAGTKSTPAHTLAQPNASLQTLLTVR